MNNKTAVITGATSGIGKAFAEKLASAGYNLVITGRREAKLKSIANELINKYKINVEDIICELADINELESLIKKVSEIDNIEILVNNAGFGTLDTFIKEDIKKNVDMITVHNIVPLKLSYAIIPNMIKNKKGFIINVSSMGAFFSGKTLSVYNSTKAFLNTFSKSLNLELKDKGIKVQALCPGFTKTDFHEKIGFDTKKFDSKGFIKWMTPDEVVDYSLKKIKSNKVICIPGFRKKFLALLLKIIPSGLLDKLDKSEN